MTRRAHDPPHTMIFSGRTLATAWVLLCLLVALSLVGCSEEDVPPDVVARVGDRYLTQAEIDETLASLPVGRDSSEVRQQMVERWVTNELLYQEAKRRDLREDPEVQRLLEENERSVLISALISSMYDQEPIKPTPNEIRTYYERNKEQLTLREPFVQVRYLATASPDSSEAARADLQQAVRTGRADSLWQIIARRYAQDPDGSLKLAQHYYPEQQLFADTPEVQSVLAGLQEGQIAAPITVNGRVHVLQLVDRVPAGSTPELAWIEEELRQRLVVQTRKQMYARQVQRLRNEAQSRRALDVY